MEHNDYRVSPLEISAVTSSTHAGMQDRLTNSFAKKEQISICGATINVMDTSEMQHMEGYHPSSTSNQDTPLGLCHQFFILVSFPLQLLVKWSHRELVKIYSAFKTFITNSQWQLPYVQERLIGKRQARRLPRLPLNSQTHDHPLSHPGVQTYALRVLE